MWQKHKIKYLLNNLSFILPKIKENKYCAEIAVKKSGKKKKNGYMYRKVNQRLLTKAGYNMIKGLRK